MSAETVAGSVRRGRQVGDQARISDLRRGEYKYEKDRWIVSIKSGSGSADQIGSLRL
jgi:hypothetical protein